MSHMPLTMEATLSSPIPRLPVTRFQTKPCYHKRNGLLTIRKLLVNAKQGGESEGESVNENPIVLRLRIKKLKVLEANKNQDQARLPSSDWNEWERKLFTHYHEDVFEAMELLQSYFMKTRPSVALGVLALVAMSVPLSQSDFLGNALKVAKGLLAGCHVCIDIDF
ncbi:hypothetical protein Pfo_019246 [Paulownia fortunei]|nr:hypothetical protein Pfo_019246 [Paulownia fortunei]